MSLPVAKAKVPRVKHYRCWTWSHMPGFYKDYHSIGRTAEGRLDTLAIEAEVASLEATFGTRLDARDASLRQRLDFVATSMLESSRRSLRSDTKGTRRAGTPNGAFDGTLSAPQWALRRKRELVFDPAMMDGLQQAHSEGWRTFRRAERRRAVERVGIRPHDHTGDYLVLHSPIYGVEIEIRGNA